MKELSELRDVVFKLRELEMDSDNAVVSLLVEFIIELISVYKFNDNADLITAISDGFVELDRAIKRARRHVAWHWVRTLGKQLEFKDIDISALVLLNNAFPEDKPELLEITNNIYNALNESVDKALREKIVELIALNIWKLIRS